MLQYDWDHSIGYWIVLTANSVRRALNAELSQQGITLRQWEVLASLALGGELSQSELAERLGIEAPTLVGILDRMERDGWLERYACSQDRRRKRIRCTDKTETLWARMVACAHAVRAKAIQGLDPAELEQLKATCAHVRGNLGDTYDPHAVPAVEADRPEIGRCDGPDVERG